MGNDAALRLSMEGRGGGTPKQRSGSGFLMGNPMAAPSPGQEDEGERDSSASVSSVNSMDRLPRGVDVFRKPSLDIFQSKSKRR